MLKKALAIILCAVLTLTVLAAASAGAAVSASVRADIGSAQSTADRMLAARQIATAVRVLIRLYDKDMSDKARSEIARLAGFGLDTLPEPQKEFLEIARAMIKDREENKVDFGTMASLILAAAEESFKPEALDVLGTFLQKMSDRVTN